MVVKLCVDRMRQIRTVLERLAGRRERIVLTFGGKDAAVLVPIEDLALLEMLEDQRDAQQARDSEVEAASEGEAPLAWGELKRTLGL